MLETFYSRKKKKTPEEEKKDNFDQINSNEERDEIVKQFSKFIQKVFVEFIDALKQKNIFRFIELLDENASNLGARILKLEKKKEKLIVEKLI